MQQHVHASTFKILTLVYRHSLSNLVALSLHYSKNKMRVEQIFFITALLVAAHASPLPSFEDIERRWNQGESEVGSTPERGSILSADLIAQAQIHANHHIREASPAWLVDRTAEIEANDEFAYSPDRRTLETRKQDRLSEKRDSPGLYGAMKSFVNNFWKHEGKGRLIARRADDDAPILKPKKSMRYYFSA